MKEMIAIIRPGRWPASRAKLQELGVSGYTTARVYGRGRQKGLRYLNRNGQMGGMRYIPKRLVWLWLHEEQVTPVAEALMTVNRTGRIGDGKIFICPAEDALRVRTGDHGELALL